VRVLLVEPNEHEQRRYVTILGQCMPMGTSIEGVGSAEDALVRLRATEFEVVITEERLPNLSGLDLLRFLQRYAPDAVRVLTTYSTHVGFARQAKAAADPDLLVTKTGEPQRWCDELKAVLGARGLWGEQPTPGVSGPTASPTGPRSTH